MLKKLFFPSCFFDLKTDETYDNFLSHPPSRQKLHSCYFFEGDNWKMYCRQPQGTPRTNPDNVKTPILWTTWLPTFKTCFCPLRKQFWLFSIFLMLFQKLQMFYIAFSKYQISQNWCFFCKFTKSMRFKAHKKQEYFWDICPVNKCDCFTSINVTFFTSHETKYFFSTWENELLVTHFCFFVISKPKKQDFF